MTTDSSRQGVFGSQVKPVRQKASWLRTAGGYLLLFVCSILVPLSLWGWDDFYRNFIEREAPVIEIRKPPVGLGADSAELDLVISDRYSGLDAVAVRIEQGGKATTVFQKQYSTKTIKDELRVPLNGKDRGLRKGEARLSIVVFDRSFWSNAARASLSFIVDYDRPEITVFPDQHNATVGGAELVFYRVADENPGFSGITIGSELLPGFPAKNFDPEFEPFPDLYLVFFPLPRNLSGGSDSIRIFARDAVGNMSYAPLPYHLQPSAGKEVVLPVTAALCDEHIDPLFEQFSIRRAKLAGDPVRPTAPSASDEDRTERLKTVNQDFRELIQQGLKPLFSRPKSQRFWQGIFARNPGKELQGFGDQVTIRLGEKIAAQYRQGGMFLAVPLNSEIRAANSGIVIFADDLGVYGKTVIVDHGFGLTSLYANLSSFERLEGDRVERGDVIARSGASGFVFAPGMTFEMRLHGEPVRPIEWLDQTWQRDHIEAKVKNAKKQLGIHSVGVLE